MKKLSVSVAFALIALASHAFAQNPSDGDTVKITTTLVQIDVSVTDNKGKPVQDLRPSDFEVFENGRKQTISNFSFISNVRETTEKPTDKPKDQVAVPIPPVEIRPDQVRRTIALVIDDLSLSFESAYYVRRALKKFVDEQMQDGDLVAIIRTSAGIGALQQFTANKTQLYAAIEKVKWNPLGRGNIGAFAPIEPTMNEILAASGDPTVTEEDIQAEKNTLAAFDDFRNASFAIGTLGALRFIITGMSELPGRKSVILFSDGIRLFPRDQDGQIGNNTVFDFMRQLVDQANRASVVFYTLDARGLVATGITAQDQIISPTADAINSAVSGRNQELFDTQQGLQFLAKETGGFAVINSNGLSDGVRRVLNDQSYYLIGYLPDDETFDAQKRRYNKLEIRVNRPDVKIRYRSGFINVASTDAPPKPVVALTPAQAIQKALTSPFGMDEISLRLNALFGFEQKTGPFVRSLIHVNAADMQFTDDLDGSKKATFDVLAVSFGDNGQAVDQLAKSYTMRVTDKAFERIKREGFVYQFVFPIKKPGAYQLRVAIRDSQSSKLGSASQFIEVPNLKKNRLTLSGIVLENFTVEQWRDFQADTLDANVRTTDPYDDTSTREFKRGSVLRFGYEVYNARIDSAKRPNLTAQIRIYHDRRLVLDGKPVPIEMNGQSDVARVKAVGAFTLAAKMEPGDYILQIIVFDNLAKEKIKVATQFVQFEVTQ